MVFILKTQDTKQILSKYVLNIFPPTPLFLKFFSENKCQFDTVQDMKIKILLHYFILLLMVGCFSSLLGSLNMENL